ncbi:MAG: protein phosphatase 2C domain-containing protein [Candidatus Abawacabacteria bacterium]|nr:protein phosphatase 2C domain-containing protein [Candidatus Abawacabacteria bacterium]
MKIDALYDKGSGRVNEDAFLISKKRFAVFDGASPLVPYIDGEGRTGAMIAASLARDAFEHESMSLLAAARNANASIRGAMRKVGVDICQKTALWATSAAAVELHGPEDNPTFADWLQIDDSLIVAIYRDSTHDLLAAHEDHDQQTLELWQKMVREERIEARGALQSPLMQAQFLRVRATMNVHYGAIDGEPEMEEFLRHGRLDLRQVAHLLLFTDGFLLPKKDASSAVDFKLLVKFFLKGGLKAVHEHVRTLESSDPYCTKYPRVKDHDDIAAIAVTF